MGITKMGPGGGQNPTRKDEKISPERFEFTYPGYSTKNNPKHEASLKRLLKKVQKKKRRQRDKTTTKDED